MLIHYLTVREVPFWGSAEDVSQLVADTPIESQTTTTTPQMINSSVSIQYLFLMWTLGLLGNFNDIQRLSSLSYPA